MAFPDVPVHLQRLEQSAVKAAQKGMRMMNGIDTFAVIGGDLRSAYLAGLLAEDGYKVITSGFDSTDLPPCVTGCTNPAQAVSLADCVILPLPVTTDDSTINAPFSRMRISLDQVLNPLLKRQYLVGGSVSDCVRREVEARGLMIDDYFKREELAVHNAVPHGGRGYPAGDGRTSRHHRRRALPDHRLRPGGPRAVPAAGCARREGDGGRTEVCRSRLGRSSGLRGGGAFPHAGIRRLRRDFFNTVPSLLFDRPALKALDKGTLLIDLASRPGGVDFNAAAELQIKTIWALSLPGRVARRAQDRSSKPPYSI